MFMQMAAKVQLLEILANGQWFISTSSGGSGTGFQTVSLSNNAASYSWSIPSNIVNGGINNALVVAALMTGAPIQVQIMSMF